VAVVDYAHACPISGTDHWYDVGPHRVRAVMNELANETFRPGWLRSVGGAKRLAAVLERAAAKAGWGQTLPAGVGLGVATTFGQERNMPTWTAVVAQVKADKKTGAVTL